MNRVKQKAWQGGMRHLILSHCVPDTSRSENKSLTSCEWEGRGSGVWRAQALNEQTCWFCSWENHRDSISLDGGVPTLLRDGSRGWGKPKIRRVTALTPLLLAKGEMGMDHLPKMTPASSLWSLGLVIPSSRLWIQHLLRIFHFLYCGTDGEEK